MLKNILITLFICMLWPLQSIASDAECIAVALYKEASTEGLLGKRAVMDTIITRMKASGKSACQVIKEPNQFSWVNSQRPIKATKEQLTTYRFVSKMKPVVEGARYFHNKSVKPAWVKKMRVKLKIKNHYFY